MTTNKPESSARIVQVLPLQPQPETVMTTTSGLNSPGVVCYAPGEKCLGCDQYYGKAAECKYKTTADAQPTSGWQVQEKLIAQLEDRLTVKEAELAALRHDIEQYVKTNTELASDLHEMMLGEGEEGAARIAAEAAFADAVRAERERCATICSELFQNYLNKMSGRPHHYPCAFAPGAEQCAEAIRALPPSEPVAQSEDAERHRFAMKHVSYYTILGEFIVDCDHERRPGSNASMDYEKAIDAVRDAARRASEEKK